MVTYEVTQTSGRYPGTNPGQHNNGPATVWVRKPGADWLIVPRRDAADLMRYLDEFGDEYLAMLRNGREAGGA